MLSPGRLRRLSPGGRGSDVPRGRRISPGRQGVESPLNRGGNGQGPERPDPGTAQEESRWAWDIHKVILVRRSNDKFGFYIRGGKEYGFGIFVSALDKPGNAERQGLRIGDRILRVNDVDFREITHQEAVRTIQSATRLVVYVTSYMSHKMPEKEKISEIERAKEEEARLEKEKELRNKREEEESGGVTKLYNRSVLVVPEEDGYIGCSIRGGSDYGIPVSIVDVDPSSPSQRAGLRPGDTIKNINGYDVKRMSHMQVAYLATSFSELYIDIETRDPGPRKMSLPTGFSQRENMTAYEMNFSPATLPRRRHCSGPHVVGFATPPMTFPRKRSQRGSSVDRSGFGQDIPDSSVLEAELQRLVQSSVPVFNPDAAMKLGTETIKVTKLISRTIRLNLNVATKTVEVQASPKSMKRCLKTDVRDMFKERIGSPRGSPTLSSRHLRRGSDLSRSLGPFSQGLGDLKDSKSDTRSIRSGRSGSGYASVSNCAWNIPPINWTGHVT